jgi:hypothetical protein
LGVSVSDAKKARRRAGLPELSFLLGVMQGQRTNPDFVRNFFARMVAGDPSK